jgi:cell division protein FtsN
MTDTRPAYDEESLPWLQEVEDEDAPRGISARTMLVGFLIVLLVAGAVAATFFWLGRSNVGPSGAPELIRAPATPYKVKPENPGGLDIAGESQTTFETSSGQDINSRLNLGAEGEHVATTPQPAQPEQKQPAASEAKQPPTAKPTAPEPTPAPKPSGAAGSVIQLGAYKNTAQAERAWTALSTRFSVLSGLSKVIVPYSAGGSSGYRLRAAASSPDAAREACKAIQAGGESCFIAQ